MADFTPGHDPFDERLRSTFNAEYAEVERTRSHNVPTAKNSPASWLPLAIAAALVMLAGFAWFGSRGGTDNAVGLDVAGQPESTLPETGDSQDGGGPDAPGTSDATPGAIGQTTDEATAVQVNPTPTPRPAVVVAAPTIEPSPDACVGVFITPGAWIVSGILPDDPDGGLVAHTDAAVDAPTTRILPADTEVAPTGACRIAPNGTPWFELYGDGQNDWVSSNFLRPSGETPDLCPGQSITTKAWFVWGIPDDDPDGGLVAHTEASVDAPVTRVLAQNSAVVLTGACTVSSGGSLWYQLHGNTPNDWVSSNFLRPAELACVVDELGPRDGFAIRLGEQSAFLAGPGLDGIYTWLPTKDVTFNVPCFLRIESGQELCLSGTIEVRDLVSANLLFTSATEVTVTTTGRTYVPLEQRGLREEFIEVMFGPNTVDDVGFVDPAITTVWPGTCGSRPSSGDSFSEVPCTADQSRIVDGTTSRGSDESDADHVYNLRVDERSGCARVVVEFGRDLADSPTLANQIPLIAIRKTVDATTIQLPDGMRSGFEGSQRADFTGGTALVTVNTQAATEITVLHAPGQINVWFLESPARVVIDIQPQPADPTLHSGPVVGETAVLTAPIQADRYGAGLNADSAFDVKGYARPFEASGVWYVFEANSTASLIEPINAVASGVYNTSSWVDGWGEFQVTVPGLAPGFYVVLFGEHPPSDDAPFFQGSGQYLRIGQAPPPGPERYFDAALLRQVEIIEAFGN